MLRKRRGFGVESVLCRWCSIFTATNTVLVPLPGYPEDGDPPPDGDTV